MERKSQALSVPTDRQRFAWVTLEAQEIIELKQAIMDRDSHDVVDFFWRIILPRAKEAAEKRGISLEEENEESNGRLSG
jgi:hypothetical protein